MISANSIRILLTLAAITLLLRLLLTTSVFHFINKWLTWFLHHLHAYHYYTIPRYNNSNSDEINHLYRVVSTYISSLPSLQDADHALLISTNGTNSNNNNKLNVSLHHGKSVHDSFLRAHITWTYNTTSSSGESFVLKIKLKDKSRVLRQYIQHIHKVADEILNGSREIRVHVVDESRRWRSFPFTHPATFETVLMDSEVKAKVMNDVDQFLRSRQYYNRIGRVWRRSYLLHGPASGSCKSSFVAAMAKFLRYDIYNVDHDSLTGGLSQLKAVLLRVPRKSLILIENLNQSSEITVAGVMEVIDGVTSGEERVVVFTKTSSGGELHVQEQPVVDVEVNFPVSCDFNAFKAMASTHLGIKEHRLFRKVEDLLLQGSMSTVEQVSEMMVMNRSSPGRALRTIITTLENENSVGRKGSAGHKRSESEGEWRSGSVKGARGEMMMMGGLGDESDDQSVNKRPESVRGGMRGKLYGMLRMRSGRKEELGEVAVAMGVNAAGGGEDKLEGSSHG